MEVRGVLQTIGMEAAVLAFLFGMTYFAIRVCRAERQLQNRRDDSLATVSNDPRLL